MFILKGMYCINADVTQKFVGASLLHFLEMIVKLHEKTRYVTL